MPKKATNVYQKACEVGQLVHSTYYSDTFRTELTIDGKQQLYDVMHIEIPFSPAKEALLMQRFDIAREDLPEYYKSFQKSVANNAKLSQAIQATENPTLMKSFVPYIAVKSFKKTDKEGKRIGSDVYFISEPMNNFVGSEHFNPGNLTLQNVVNFGTRMLQTIKSLNDRGFSLGSIDIDSCYLTIPGQDEENSKALLKNGYLFYGTGPDIQNASMENPDFRAAYDLDTVSQLSRGDLTPGMDSDIIMLCGLLWNILSGRHYTDPVDTTLPLIYGNDEIANYLRKGLDEGSDAYKELSVGLRTIGKKITQGQMDDVHIPRSSPMFTSKPLPEQRVDEADEEDGEKNEGEDESSSGRKRIRRKKPAAILFFIVALAAIGFMAFGDKIMLMINPPQPTATPEPTAVVDTSPKSKDMDLYVYDGIVVNALGEKNAQYITNENGDIVDKNTGEVAFESAHVSAYAAIEELTFGILDSSESPETNSTTPLLKDDVVDLRNIASPYDPDSDEPFNLYASWVRDYGIKDGTRIMVRRAENDAEEETADVEDFVLLSVKSDGEDENGAQKLKTEVISEFQIETLYKAQGTWRKTVQIKVSPTELNNNKITVKSNDPDRLKFVVTRDDEEVYAKSIKLTLSSSGTAKFVVECDAEGKYTVTATSEDGFFTKNGAITFVAGQDFPIILPEDEGPAEEVRPSPTPWLTKPPVETPTPSPSPTPTPTRDPVIDMTPTATPAPTQSPGSGGGTGGGNGGGNSEPDYPDPTGDPRPGWEAVFELSFEDIEADNEEETEFTIHIGQTFKISPSLGCTIRAEDPAQNIVSYPTVVPFEITGKNVGTIKLIFTCNYANLAGQKIEITINVIE